MIPTFTSENRRLVEPLCFVFSIFMMIQLPYAAQSQTTTHAELEHKMNALYKHARQLYADLPTRNFRGNYFTMAIGISPFGHIKTWQTEETCDCDGNVIGTQNVSSAKFPTAWTMGWENRLTNTFSFRLMGSYAHLTHGRGQNVVSENGDFTQMRDQYKLTQYGLHSSLLVHIKGFYGGAGVSRTSTSASGFKTNQAEFDYNNFNINERPPQYLDLKADVLTPYRTDFAPHFFVGYRMMWSPYVFGSVELGLAQNGYFNFQLNFPLSGNIKNSLQTWKKAHREYSKVRQEAEAIDRQLNPQKFQTTDCINTGISNGGCSN
jgi:hypothetical protein